MPEYVRVENTDSRQFTYHDNNTKKAIPPGKGVMMRWDLATTLFGDPFAMNSEKKPDRTAALTRARGNFNFELGMETMDAFESRRPHLEVYDADTQQRIFMLIDDPDGIHTAEYVPLDADSGSREQLLEARLVEMQQQITLLINQRTATAPPMASGATVTASVDGPPVPVTADTPKVAAFVDGDPFHQREDDALTSPLFDFTALSQGVTDDIPPSSVDTLATDEPGDAGVGSDGGSESPVVGKLAPKPKPH